MNPVSARLLNQQLICPQFRRPEQVVAHMGAMQAQEYKLMRWAVAMRTQKPSLKAFTKAYNEGRIVRVHLLRCTWQLVAAEDYCWMLELCGPKGLQGLMGWMHANKIDISPEEHAPIRDILVATASRLGSATKEDFAKAVAAAGVEMTDQRLSYHIRLAEFSGTLCSGLLHQTKPTYRLAEQLITGRYIGNPDWYKGTMAREDALKLLARKYFQSHSPATLEDFTWWSGLNVSDCRKGMDLLGGELQAVRPAGAAGREFFALGSCRTRGFRPGSLHLLPSYDEYLIGYKSRDIALAPEHSHHAHNNSGIFYPVVLSGGIVCAGWRPSAKPAAGPGIEPFCPSCILGSAPDAAWQAYQKYLSY